MKVATVPLCAQVLGLKAPLSMAPMSTVSAESMVPMATVSLEAAGHNPVAIVRPSAAPASMAPMLLPFLPTMVPSTMDMDVPHRLHLRSQRTNVEKSQLIATSLLSADWVCSSPVFPHVVHLPYSLPDRAMAASPPEGTVATHSPMCISGVHVLSQTSYF